MGPAAPARVREAPPTRRSTEVSVRFDAVENGTRTVEHWGRDAIPQDHAACHGFPLRAFQPRLAAWWQARLRSLGALTNN